MHTGDQPPAAILYVDDEPSSIRLVRKILERRKDYGLLEASTGRQGIHLARHAGPDLKAILIDINLPDISGYTVLRECRSIAGVRSLPMIAISAGAMTHEIEAGLEAGFDHYLTKPLDIPAFIGLIDNVIGFSHHEPDKE